MKLSNIYDFEKVSVTQLANKNQFVITYAREKGKMVYCFQSYNSLVAVFDADTDILYVSWHYWDYSKTTLKHFKMFVNEWTTYQYVNKQQFLNEIKNNSDIYLI